MSHQRAPSVTWTWCQCCLPFSTFSPFKLWFCNMQQSVWIWHSARCSSCRAAHTFTRSKNKPSFNLSRSGPLGYSVWLVLSSWCDYPIGNHLCGDCRACSCAIPPETDVRRGKKEGISNKTLGFSGSWSFIYMHHLWYNQDRSWNYNWQCQHDVSFSLSLFL